MSCARKSRLGRISCLISTSPPRSPARLAGSKAYGRLSVLAGWRTQARILFDVPPQAFVPPPKVTSSLIELIPRAQPLACASGALQRVTEAAFGQRRKMLRQSLKSLGGDPL